MVARQAAGHPHALLAPRPFQLPDAKRVVTLLDHQAIMAGKLGQHLGRAAPGQVGRGSAQHPAVSGQRLGNQVGGDGVTDANIQVDALFNQVHQAVMHVQAHIQARVALGQFRQRRGHKSPAQAKAAGNPQLAHRFAVLGADVVAHALHRIENLLRPLVHPLALLAHRHPPGGAVQQAHFKGLLKHADAFADERGRHAELFGHRREAGALGHLEEDIEVVEAGKIIHDACTKNP
ncbi:hypothetical protein D3C78_1191590 [compost metagenome]